MLQRKLNYLIFVTKHPVYYAVKKLAHIKRWTINVIFYRLKLQKNFFI